MFVGQIDEKKKNEEAKLEEICFDEDAFNVGVHENEDYILVEDKELKIFVKEVITNETLQETQIIEEKHKKAGTKPQKESSPWVRFECRDTKDFKRGWIDRNAPSRKGSGEKRRKYPTCVSTLTSCKGRGRRNSWGKRGKSKRENPFRTMDGKTIIQTSSDEKLSKGFAVHISNDISVVGDLYRNGSSGFFDLVNETRELWTEEIQRLGTIVPRRFW